MKKIFLLIALAAIATTTMEARKKPKIEWVDIPAGTFTMGSPNGEWGRDESEIQHEVTVKAFKMSKYEITFDQYDAFCKATGRTKPDDSGWGRGKRPVLFINWADAQAFAEWMGCRLPTEAEWEYACRAGTTTPFHTGDSLTTSQANYNGTFPYNGQAKGEFREKTTPVGSFAPNKWGLYDMHGNVWEWCSDVHDYGNGLQADNDTKTLRGGSLYEDATQCRSAARNVHSTGCGHVNFGIRLVKDIP